MSGIFYWLRNVRVVVSVARLDGKMGKAGVRPMSSSCSLHQLALLFMEPQYVALTAGRFEAVDGPEAGVLDGLVGFEAEPQVSAGGRHQFREGLTAGATNHRAVRLLTVPNLRVRVNNCHRHNSDDPKVLKLSILQRHFTLL